MSLPAFFSSISLLLLTSAYEGVPYTIIEAACLGVPIVTTKVGGILELLDDEVIRVIDGHQERVIDGHQAYYDHVDHGKVIDGHRVLDGHKVIDGHKVLDDHDHDDDHHKVIDDYDDKVIGHDDKGIDESASAMIQEAVSRDGSMLPHRLSVAVQRVLQLAKGRERVPSEKCIKRHSMEGFREIVRREFEEMISIAEENERKGKEKSEEEMEKELEERVRKMFE